MNQRSKIAILGFGVEGKSALDYLFKHGYHNLTICDQNVDLKENMPQGVSVNLGPHYLNDLDKFEVIFRSPGIRYFDPMVQLAVQKGSQVTSATNFFIDQCPCPIIGVTGTKGKGTTCTLIYEMLQKNGWQAGVNVFLGGNIGQCPMEFLDKLNAKCLVILELSSFQLQDLKKSPRYAVMLNTTSDHLDYHVDRDEYLHAKENMLAWQGEESVAVLNRDYEYSKYYKTLVKGDLKWVSRSYQAGTGGGSVIKNGAYVKDGEIYYVKKGKSQLVVGVNEIALVGSHNLENILPALVIAKELGVSLEECGEVIGEFKNLPHRLQFVREVGGVKYYNDSYSTTPETSMAAVDSFAQPTVLIAGGYDKGADYNDWAVKILSKESLHTVILIGATADKMEKALVEAEGRIVAEGEGAGEVRAGACGDSGFISDAKLPVFYPTKILRRNRLEDAVIDAYAESDEGGVVVMSPAAASFDMFKNYKERGNEFVAQVRKLK